MSWPRIIQFVLGIVILHQVSCGIGDVPGLHYKIYTIKGDIELGAIFPIQAYGNDAKCGKALRNTAIMQYIEAIVFGLKKANSASILPNNITIGAVIVDSCMKDEVALARGLTFIPQSSKNDVKKIVGVIGAMRSSASMVVASLLGLYDIPQISYASTAKALSDKLKYPTFFRLISPDQFQVKTMIDIVLHFGWSYISVLYSDDEYGYGAMRDFKRYTGPKGICIAYEGKIATATSTTEYTAILKKLQEEQNARVVILFFGPTQASGFFSAVKKNGVQRKFVWIGSEAWTLRMSQMPKNLFPYMAGTIMVSPIQINVPAFNKYFLKLNPSNRADNPWFKEFWQNVFNCKYEAVTNITSDICNDTEHLSSTNVRPMKSIAPVIDSVAVYAHALAALIKDNCPNITKDELQRCVTSTKLLHYIKMIKIQGYVGQISFDKNGDILGRYSIQQLQDGSKKVDIGTNDIKNQSLKLEHSLMKWYIDGEIWGIPQNSTTVPESVCSKLCEPGYFTTKSLKTCCWTCQKCRTNEIVIYDNTSCLPCPIYFWPNQETFKNCRRIAETYLKITDLYGIILLSLAAGGCLLVLLVSSCFITYKNQKLIKASSRELSSLILVGTVIGFVTVFMLLLPPTVASCQAAYICFTLGFTVVYAPILSKTNRVYRIFSYGKKTKQQPPLVSPISQLMISGTLIAVQIAISTVTSVTISPPYPGLSMPIRTVPNVNLSCTFPTEGIIAFLAYNLILVLLCVFFAFKTRSVPDNYNESRFVSMCVYTTVIVWITFIPTYFINLSPYYRVMVLSLAHIVNGYVTLGFLFVPKIYAIRFVAEEKQRAVVSHLIQVQPKHSTSPGTTRESREAMPGASSL